MVGVGCEEGESEKATSHSVSVVAGSEVDGPGAGEAWLGASLDNWTGSWGLAGRLLPAFSGTESEDASVACLLSSVDSGSGAGGAGAVSNLSVELEAVDADRSVSGPVGSDVETDEVAVGPPTAIGGGVGVF